MTRPPTEAERTAMFVLGALIGRLTIAALKALDRRADARRTALRQITVGKLTGDTLTAHVVPAGRPSTALTEARREHPPTDPYRHQYGADTPESN